MLTALAVLIIGYLVGSISNGVWIGKVFFHKDIRKEGSGNSGGTNAGRVLGKKVGFIVIVLDMLKSIGSVYAVWAILTFTPLHVYYEFANNPAIFQDLKPLYYWLTGLSAAIGHCWPIYLNFKGGKAAATLMGLSTMSSWIGLGCGLVYFGTLKFKKMVSLSSIVSGVVQSLAAWVIFFVTTFTDVPLSMFSWTFALGDKALVWGFWYAVVITMVSVLLIVRHSSNIKRMKEGQESKITWMK
ncbi:MAG: glycerol-3-phosphate 1-O-acyltransferase PlsY [Bacilli bacterium]|nr:glycerol-3-phosphate 1-O-acyltransferase PlsY [Bacilli bacterium]